MCANASSKWSVTTNAEWKTRRRKSRMSSQLSSHAFWSGHQCRSLRQKPTVKRQCAVARNFAFIDFFSSSPTLGSTNFASDQGNCRKYTMRRLQTFDMRLATHPAARTVLSLSHMSSLTTFHAPWRRPSSFDAFAIVRRHRPSVVVGLSSPSAVDQFPLSVM